MTSSFLDNNFLFVLVIVVIIVHLILMVILVYHSCCKDGCGCRKKTSNQTSDQAAEQENADFVATQTNNASSGLNSLEDIRVNRRTVPPVTTWQSSLLARVRDRLQRNNNPRVNNSDNRLPQSHSGQPSHSAYTNEGISFDDNTDRYLPTYEQFSRQQEMNYMYFNNESGEYEMEMPPSYQEVMEYKDVQNGTHL